MQDSSLTTLKQFLFANIVLFCLILDVTGRNYHLQQTEGQEQQPAVTENEENVPPEPIIDGEEDRRPPMPPMDGEDGEDFWMPPPPPEDEMMSSEDMENG